MFVLSVMLRLMYVLVSRRSGEPLGKGGGTILGSDRRKRRIARKLAFVGRSSLTMYGNVDSVRLAVSELPLPFQCTKPSAK
eukprot:6486637-Amphidinium_carterae.1